MTSFAYRVLKRAPPAPPWNNPEPVREELFGVERLEEHARSLALKQSIAPSASKDRKLAARLAENEAALFDAYRSISDAIAAGHAITPAAEWLVDNYHLVETQIREIRSDLPPGYYRQLPKLAEGPFTGYPRVFGLTWAFVAHTDSHFDPDLLCRVVQAYQEVQPLTIGQLWAVAITLRIVLIENLRRLAEKIMRSSVGRQQADDLVDRLLGTGDRLLDVALKSFAPLATARGRVDLAAQWQEHAGRLESAIEREAWDGDWYRRAWFDDGTALGSAANDECRIDSIAQSWAVIFGAADPDRAARAMSAVEKQLINTGDRLALLFTPPFDKTDLDPGYIKGYPPGVRENGGQYSHAAMWSIIAFTKLGEGDKAAALFSLLNPINHARTPAEVERYKVEPFVVAADVYSMPPHVGRGGWTWYTGSAGWMYRAGIENIIGLQVQAGHLRLDPCVPKAWPSFRVTLRYRSSRYEILVENPDGVSSGIVSALVDGIAMTHCPLCMPLVDDGASHRVLVRLG